MERDAFLAKVTAHLPRPGAVPGDDDDYTSGPLIPDLGEQDPVARFRERLIAIDGEFHEAPNASAALQVIVELAERHHAATHLSWDDDHLPVAGVTAALAAAGVGRLQPLLGSEPDQIKEREQAYGAVRLGVTGAAAALAETGTVVLTSGPGRPRMASLIPLAHIALLERHRISPSLSHWVADNQDAARDAANLILVSGPSRTADIEQTLNLGVHGPKHLHVVCLP